MTTTRDEDGPEPVAVGTPAAPIAYVGISPEAKAKADQLEAKLRAMLSTPATEPQAGLDTIANAARLLLKKWDADTAMGLVYDASAFVSLMRSIAARPAPQPAADTRVVTVAQLKRAMSVAREAGEIGVWRELNAIVGGVVS